MNSNGFVVARRFGFPESARRRPARKTRGAEPPGAAPLEPHIGKDGLSQAKCEIGGQTVYEARRSAQPRGSGNNRDLASGRLAVSTAPDPRRTFDKFSLHLACQIKCGNASTVSAPGPDSWSPPSRHRVRRARRRVFRRRGGRRAGRLRAGTARRGCALPAPRARGPPVRALAEAGIEKAGVMDAKLADRRIDRRHFGGEIGRDLHFLARGENVESSGSRISRRSSRAWIGSQKSSAA